MLLWPEQPGGQQLTVLLWAHQHLLPVHRLLHDAELHSHLCGLHAHCWRSYILHDMRHLHLQVFVLSGTMPTFVLRQCHATFFCFVISIFLHLPIDLLFPEGVGPHSWKVDAEQGSVIFARSDIVGKDWRPLTRPCVFHPLDSIVTLRMLCGPALHFVLGGLLPGRLEAFSH